MTVPIWSLSIWPLPLSGDSCFTLQNRSSISLLQITAHQHIQATILFPQTPCNWRFCLHWQSSSIFSTQRPSGCEKADQAMTLWWWQDSSTSGRWNGAFVGDVWPLALLRTLRLLHEFQLKCHLVREIFLPLLKWAIPSLSTHHPLSLHS